MKPWRGCRRLLPQGDLVADGAVHGASARCYQLAAERVPLKIFADTNRSAAASLAVALLVVQTFLTAWVGAAMAGQPMLDAFGNPICTSGTHDAGTPLSGHGDVPSCCTLGCFSSSPPIDAPDASAAAPLFAAGSVILADRLLASPVVAGLEHHPGSPRALPLPA